MDDLRHKVIYLVSWVVSKVPFLFSRRQFYISKHFFEMKSYISRYDKSYEKVKTYSLLEPRLKWKAKAVSTVLSLSPEDAKQILSWKSSYEVFRRVNANISMIRQGTENIGLFEVSTTKNNPTVDAYLGIESKYVRSCSVNLLVLNGGKYYLSIYWFLTNEATNLLKDVDISGLPSSETNYITCNPLSNRYGMASRIDKLKKAKKLLEENLNTIYASTKVAEKALKKLLKLKSIPISATTLDIHIDDESSYYIEHKDTANENEISDQRFRVDSVALHRYASPLDGVDGKAFYNEHFNWFFDSNFDSAYLKSQATSEVDKYSHNDFSHIACHPVDSHIIFALLRLTHKSITELDSKFSDYVLSTCDNPSKNYEKLYLAYIEVTRIEDELKSMLKSKREFQSWLGDEYVDEFILRVGYYLEDVGKLKSDIEDKKSSSNELVESGNLKYQKRMSVLVAGLASIQIVIALASLKDPNIQEIASNWFNKLVGTIDFLSLHCLLINCLHS